MSLLFQHPDTDPNLPKQRERAVILILSYHLMKMSPLQPRQYQNQRTRLVKQKSFLKQRLALTLRLLSKSMMLILILTQSQFQTQIEKTGTDSDPDCKVRDFGFGFGSGGARYAQTGDGAQPQPDDELSSGWFLLHTT